MAIQLETPEQAARRIRLQRSRGRELDARHLSRIRQLPCVSCLIRGSHAYPPSEAAHLRIGDLSYGVEHVGLATKPHDWLVLPLCGRCHRWGKHAEHNTGSTRKFYDRLGVDPVDLAIKLYEAAYPHQSDTKAVNAMYCQLEVVAIFGGAA